MVAANSSPPGMSAVKELPWAFTTWDFMQESAKYRGPEACLRRPATLEPGYLLVLNLPKSGLVQLPDGDTTATKEVRTAGFRLLRNGAFCHTVAPTPRNSGFH